MQSNNYSAIHMRTPRQGPHWSWSLFYNIPHHCRQGWATLFSAASSSRKSGFWMKIV